MKKPQWITAGIAACLVLLIFKFGKTVLPKKNSNVVADPTQYMESISFNSILTEAKKHLTEQQVVRINGLENSISRGDVKQQQLDVYHQLAHFWGDSARIFEPYAWYEAEAARLENSEKSLTFAAHLFLDNLQADEVMDRRKWKALQAKDLFERSLKINPENDSSKVGLGACYIYGNISASPMEGISKIREVAESDSTNVYAQLTLAKGSLISGQYDKAIGRLLTVNRLNPENLEPIMLLADLFERQNNNEEAIVWYEKSLPYLKRQDIRREVENRIMTLKEKSKN